MQSIERVSQTDLVVKELTRFFLTDQIAEGDKLPTEMVLCEKLHVGRSTIRESIKALQVMGYVKIEPGRGAFLIRKNLETPVHRILSWLGSRKVELGEFIEVRMQLETLAVRLVVERGTKEDIDAIDELRLEYEKVLASGPFDEKIGDKLGDLDAAFHSAIGQASYNPLLIELNNIVIEAFKEFRARTFKVESHAQNAVVPHRKIVAALQKRDATAAQRYMNAHLFRALEDMSLGAGE